MSNRGDEIEETAESGGPFWVGEELTIYQAAMVYSGRHPGGHFVNGTLDWERASLNDFEVFLGRRAREGERKLAWDVYCELLNKVKARKIEPVRTAYLPKGELDPRDTVIKTADVAALARERRESPKYLAPWMIAPPTDTREGARPLPEATPSVARKPRMSDAELKLKLSSFLKQLESEGRRFNQETARKAAEAHFGKVINRSRFRLVYRSAGLNQDGGRPRKTPPKIPPKS
jgi:hypothetical protein